MSEANQRLQQRGHEVQVLLTTMSTMMFTESTRNWKTETINQLQEVFNGLNESTKTVDSIKEVNAALETEEPRAYFDKKTNRFGIKHEDAFDTSQQKDD
jgi:hypothetical protein